MTLKLPVKQWVQQVGDSSTTRQDMIRRNFFDSELQKALEQRLDDADRAMFADLYSQSPLPQIPVIPLGSTDAPFELAGLDRLPAETHQADPESTAGHRIKTSSGDIWVSGNVLLCECPDCAAPMTIRVWLELADCWRCNTSIQLTAEQIEVARQWVASAPLPKTDTQAADSGSIAIGKPSTSFDPDTFSITVDEEVKDSHAELRRLTESSMAAKVLRRGMSMVPAWLISFLLHLILILLLALIVLTNADLPPTITLSSFVSPDQIEGGEIRIENPQDRLVDDLRMAADLEIDSEEIRDVIQRAERDARELQVDETPIAPLPDLDDIKQNITTRPDQLISFAARDPRVRAEIVHRQGGTSLTEAAVARGLRWLASVQNSDGSWSLDNYDRSSRANNKGDAAATSLALLPFLGAGQTHEFGMYKQTVAKGLAWLMKYQEPDGDLRADFPGQAGMYAHGQASIVLCEALAMTGDEQLREPAQKAIDFIQQAQHRRGGWRYKPGQSGDTSMLGWQLMALQSARAPNMGLSVDEDTLRLADYYLDQATYDRQYRRGQYAGLPRGALYTYQAGQGTPTAPMTAEALLCRMYLGWKRDDPRLMSGVKWLAEKNPPSTREKNIYYWYYATQVMHHYGGKHWERWNKSMRQTLVSTQEKRGSRAGSWSPKGYRWGPQGGRIYVTSLAVCTLEIYYRHLPIFEQIQLDGQ